MHAHRVLTLDLEGRAELICEFDDKPSGLGFLPDGTPLAVLMRKRHIVRFSQSGFHLHADLSVLPGRYLNDMVVDATGRAYVGQRAGWKPGTAAGERSPETLTLVHPTGRVETVAEDLWGPNGSAITPDGKTLIVAESRGDRLTAFSIDERGNLSQRRIFAQMDSFPDGICLDAEGAVWAGLPLKSEFVRVQDGGAVLGKIPISDGKWAIACMLGGENRRILFMLTAYESYENIARLTDFNADLTSTSRGFVEVVEVPIPGAGLP